MQINYIILTHKSPIQLERLISKLDDEDINFFIHIDAKTNIEPFKYLEKDNVIFLEDRIDVIWGDFSIVQATLNAMKSIIEHKDQGYTILLSGQDYPIKSNQKIKEYLSKNQDFDFINYAKIDTVWKRYRERIVARKINFSSKKKDFSVIYSIFDIHSLFEFCILGYNILKFFIHSPLKNYTKLFSALFTKRKIPISTQYGGWAWWAFRYNTIKEIFNLIEKRRDVVAYYKECLLPDEMFFQTLIHLIPNYDLKIKDTITYTNWGKGKAVSPITFDENNLEELLQQPSNKLFARKFDIDQKGIDILDKIDKLIL
jgi:alr4323 protein